MPEFDFARCATQGARHYQEDSATVLPSGDDAQPVSSADRASGGGGGGGTLIAVLADGMGGHAGGALASRTVCERFVGTCANRNGPVPERLFAALEAANAAVADTVDANPMLSGMGSTLVGTVFSEAGVQWISVGDSPLLLFRRGEIALLNEDHSLAPELDRLVEAGHMTAEEAHRDPRRHMLRSAVTGDEIDLVDVSLKPLQLEPGDYVILASDGLHTLQTAEIARIVSAYGGDGAEAVASALIREVEAMREPHQDNATVIAVRLKPDLADSA
ncbi:MAG: serine/threonine-protein phosphatase [Hyphomicrobiaceae bacterium]|nr:serine/threonine-protein phosphatase [Hyphomicrobiaceae bacterium]